jgi:hypothetical protein
VHVARSCIELQTIIRVPSPPTYESQQNPHKQQRPRLLLCRSPLDASNLLWIELSPRAEGVGVESPDGVESWNPSCSITLDGELNWR